jgi:hypothetical protein
MLIFGILYLLLFKYFLVIIIVVFGVIFLMNLWRSPNIFVALAKTIRTYGSIFRWIVEILKTIKEMTPILNKL